MTDPSGLPLVAIVTPVYNGADFLAETLESVQALDYPNLVHVVLDNASTDDTAKIIDAYRGRRVPLIAARNPELLPMMRNWNAAVRMAPKEAKYFHLLCGDDTFAPNAIRREVEIAERDPEIGFVACLWRADALCGEEIPRDREVFSGAELLRSYFRREHMGLSGMFALIRTSKIDPDLPFYDTTLAVANDSDAQLRIAVTGKVGFVHEELVYWRRHQGQETATTTISGQYIMFDWLVLLDRYAPYVMGHREYIAVRRAWRRYYLRRLLLARRRSREVWDWHMRAMTARDDAPTLWDFVDAMLDWGLALISGQREKVGRTRRPAFGAPALLPKGRLAASRV